MEIIASNKRSLRGEGQDGETKRWKIQKETVAVIDTYMCGYRKMEDFVQDGL
jgi:hypothetical protein